MFKKTGCFIIAMSIVFLMENRSFAIMSKSWIAIGIKNFARHTEITNHSLYSKRSYSFVANRNLYNAIRGDDFLLMKAVLFKSKPNLNEIDNSGESYIFYHEKFNPTTEVPVHSALMVAAAYNRIHMIRPLIEAGADPNYTSGDVSALTIAICNNYFDFAEKLISHSIDKSTINHALHVAFRFLNQREIVSFLISKGAEVNHVDNNGMTVLMNAVKYAPLEVVDDLIQSGANVHSVGPDDVTAMSVALNMFDKYMRIYNRVGMCFLEIMRILVEAGADVQSESMYRTCNAIKAAITAKREDLVQFFVDHGARY